MTLINFELIIYFPKFSLHLDYCDLDDIYLFIFSLHGLNPKVCYLIKDIFHDRIIDILWQSDLDSELMEVLS